MSRDTALTGRILSTLVVVLALDALFVSALAFLLRPWLAPVVAVAADTLGVAVGEAVAGAALVVPATALFAWAQLRYTRRETLAEADAAPVTEDEYPDLHARVRRLAATADVRTPTLAVADTAVPNSFAVGGVRNATLVVSTGLVEALADDELDAVLAHELAHVANRDAAVMTLATFLPALASSDYSVFADLRDRWGTPAVYAVAGVGLAALYASGAKATGSSAATFLLPFAALVAVSVVFGGVLLGAVATPVVYLSQRLSRQREFAADRAGALLAGSPAAMATALERLDDDAASPAPATDFRIEGGVRELCFLPNGFAAASDSGDDRASGPRAVEGLPLDPRSHPPTDERVDRLRALEAEA